MRVSPYAISREVSVGQEAALAVKRRAVAMEALSEGQHDVRELVDLVSDLAVGDLSEGERDHALPHFEGSANGFIRGSLANLGGVVLYAAMKDGEKGGIKAGMEDSSQTKVALGFPIKAFNTTSFMKS